MARIVCGVGVNDSEYDVTRGVMIGGEWKITWICPYYQRWKSMLKRCYSKKYTDINKSYASCVVCDSWLLFSKFRDWMALQDWEGKELDKDIIFKGNKIYSPATCAFVSQATNKFVTDAGGSRGDHPVGVHLSRGLYCAECRNPFTARAEHLGRHKSPSDAHLAWKKRKHELACQLADLQVDERVAEALRSRYL
jgi:hypothetical protein